MAYSSIKIEVPETRREIKPTVRSLAPGVLFRLTDGRIGLRGVDSAVLFKSGAVGLTEAEAVGTGARFYDSWLAKMEAEVLPVGTKIVLTQVEGPSPFFG